MEEVIPHGDRTVEVEDLYIYLDILVILRMAAQMRQIKFLKLQHFAVILEYMTEEAANARGTWKMMVNMMYSELN